jgi:hypothetical protein
MNRRFHGEALDSSSHVIRTRIFSESIKSSINWGYFEPKKGNIELINNFLMALAEEQINAAFDQSEKRNSCYKYKREIKNSSFN